MDRRGFFAFAAATLGAATLPTISDADTLETPARIVIIGAGAGGTALANRLVQRLSGASIMIIDPRKEHIYQPGLSLVAAGLRPADYVVSETADWLSRGVTLVQEAAVAIDPVARSVTTSGGTSYPYDFLVLTPGRYSTSTLSRGFRWIWPARTASVRSMQGQTKRR